MIEVMIDSVRMSLMSQHRIVLLKDGNQDRFLPIWIGGFEAEAITHELQEVSPPRPMTHDLMKTLIEELGGQVVHILVNDLRQDVYYARVVISVNGKRTEIDARPSDAISLAVRTKCPIFVAEMVMDKAAITAEASLEAEELDEAELSDAPRLSAFEDFVDNLDLDLGDDD